MNRQKDMDNLRSVEINTLICHEPKYRFFIPAYQRGYRWEALHATKLLDDLYEYNKAKSLNDSTVGDFYCLQPIIVKKINQERKDFDEYEVVDGQQRLTTIYILLKYVQRKNCSYDLCYERDEGIKTTLKRKDMLDKLGLDTKLEDIQDFKQTADGYYFFEVFKAIKKWFDDNEKNNGSIISEMESVLIAKTRIIWYEISKDEPRETCYEVFKNINNGKIPLTNAELLKAMFLNSRYCSPILDTLEESKNLDKNLKNKLVKQSQDLYARLWDDIQHKLSDDNFWTFLTGGHIQKMDTRMDFLFELIIKKEKPNYKSQGDWGVFTYFEEEFNQQQDNGEKRKYVEGLFKKLRETFDILQEWYNNVEIYNYLGFLVNYKDKSSIDYIVTSIKEYGKKGKTKDDFIEYLKIEIRSILSNKIKTISEEDLNNLNYLDDKKTIEQLLMLFNICELNKIGQKFNFVLQKGKWSLEHINAQHSEVVSADDRQKYLDNELKRIEKCLHIETDENKKKKYEEIQREINAMINNKGIDADSFNELATKIEVNVDGFNKEDKHCIGNLALISTADNSSLSNSAYYSKRAKIIEYCQDRTKNIPYATRAVFMKEYSNQEYGLDFTKWSKDDCRQYFMRQKLTLNEFFGGDNDK